MKGSRLVALLRSKKNEAGAGVMSKRMRLLKNAMVQISSTFRKSTSQSLHEQPLGPNTGFIGLPGGRKKLATPCLILDLENLQANIGKMASLVGRSGKRLRPHAKAHKSVEIARRQIQAGASGIAVATIGEAEIFFAHDITDILLTSTFASTVQIDRVVNLNRQGCALSLVLDHADIVQALGARLENTDMRIRVFIDIDMGRKRSGVVSLESALALAKIIRRQRSLDLAGIQAYAGHLSHLADFSERRQTAGRCQEYAKEIRRALSSLTGRNMECTGGSTGSFMLDLSDDVLDELQYGSYVFMDEEYLAIDPDGSRRWPFQPSLFVQTTVISANSQGWATTDAGDKRFANKYGALPRIVAPGVLQKSIYRPVSDEHGQIELKNGEQVLIGEKVECIIPHSDPTANLFNQYHIVEGDRLVDIWPVDARGVL